MSVIWGLVKSEVTKAKCFQGTAQEIKIAQQARYETASRKWYALW